MGIRKILFPVITVLFSSFILMSAVSACTPKGACGSIDGGATGSDCSPGSRCEDSLIVPSGTCEVDASCEKPVDTGNECSPDSTSCDYSACGPNKRCSDLGNGYVCWDSPGQCTGGPEICNPAGGSCTPCCKTGLVCSPLHHRCLPPDSLICNDSTCPSLTCGPGYRCVNQRCSADPACIKQAIDVEYTGPKIKSFTTVMAAVYNLLFPGAILFGALTIIIAGYKLMTSEGDPRKTKEGQEDLTAAVLGTAFVVLSVAILRIIISQILGGTVGF